MYLTYIEAKSFKNNFVLPIFIIATLARLMVGFSAPIFEDDYYRYQWDGRVMARGINPYSHPPKAKELDVIDIEYRDKVGYPHLRTIYPPLAQMLFAFNAHIFQGTLLGLKFLFILFDLLTGFLLIRWLQLRRENPGLSIFYLLNPMVIKEIANSSHLDSCMVFFFALAVYWLESSKQKNKGEYWAWLALSLSVLIKLIPILALPYFFKLTQKKWRSLGIFILALILFSIPFMGSPYFMDGLKPFTKYWVFNEALFYPISYISNKAIVLLSLDHWVWMKTALVNEYPARMVGGVILLSFMVWRYFQLTEKLRLSVEVMSLVALLLLLSSVFNTWYGLWFLVFAVVNHNKPLIFLSFIGVLSYSWYWDKNIYNYFHLFEYLMFFAFFIYSEVRKKTIFKKSK